MGEGEERHEGRTKNLRGREKAMEEERELISASEREWEREREGWRKGWTEEVRLRKGGREKKAGREIKGGREGGRGEGGRREGGRERMRIRIQMHAPGPFIKLFHPRIHFFVEILQHIQLIQDRSHMS